VTGFILLVAVYYGDGGQFLLPAGSSMPPSHALALGLLVVFGGFAVYDLFWRTPLAKRYGVLAGLISLGLLFWLTYELHLIFNGRSAYLHIGAMIGTCMAGNVFLHIIPSQKALISQINAGGGYNKDLSVRAKTRSIHNNYLTFPMIFTMISNHFAGLFGHELNWLILIVIMVAAALVRHFMNIRWTFKPWLAGIGGTLGVAAVVLGPILYAPGRAAATTPADLGEPVSFAEARAIVHKHCISCHSKWPTFPGMEAANKGVHYDYPDEIKRHAPKMYEQAVAAPIMPMGNMTGMTDAERETLGRWIKQGAKLE